MPARQARKTVVIVDTREPDYVKLAMSATLDDAPEFVALPEADFLLVDPDACMLGIERKTWSDFLASLGDGRLVSQLTRMKGSYPYQGLILEGSYTVDGEGYLSCSIGTRWTHAALQMTLFSIQRNFPDLIVFYSVGLGATADIIRALAARGKTKGCMFKTTLFAGLAVTEEGAGEFHPISDRRSARRTRRSNAAPALRRR